MNDPLPATDVADRLFRAIEAGDIDAVGTLYASDVEVWHNTDQVAQGRDANLATLGWVMHHLPGLRYTQTRRQATAEGLCSSTCSWPPAVLRARSRCRHASWPPCDKG